MERFLEIGHFFTNFRTQSCCKQNNLYNRIKQASFGKDMSNSYNRGIRLFFLMLFLVHLKLNGSKFEKKIAKLQNFQVFELYNRFSASIWTTPTSQREKTWNLTFLQTFNQKFCIMTFFTPLFCEGVSAYWKLKRWLELSQAQKNQKKYTTGFNSLRLALSNNV